MDFQAITNKDKPVLVFFAEGCGYCKFLLPILEELENRVGETASVLKINIEENPQIADTYQVRVVPTLITFKNGEIRWR